MLATVASRGEGVADLLDAVESHHAWLTGSGELARRRTRRASAEVEAIAVAGLRTRWGGVGHDHLELLAAEVAQGVLDPYAAADRLLTGPTAPEGG